ncbi:MAG: hypothetical protein JXQ73_26765 [Phycisphaerae bacterium]|nr:hypothetical protein [Phycisphaerae bacterium]
MAFLKRNLFMILCLLAALASVGLGVVACNSYDGINKSMQQAADFGTRLAGAGKVSGRTNPVTNVDLAAQEQNIKTVQGSVQETLNRAKAVNETGLDYLVPEAFPNPRTNPDIPLRFIANYRKALDALRAIVKAKGPPTQEDVNEVQRRIELENEERGLTSPKSSGGKAEPAARPPTDDRRRGALGGLQSLSFDGRPSGRDRTPAKAPARATPKAGASGEEQPLSEEERLRTDPKRRAELERAQQIYCYVGNRPEETFTKISAVEDINAPANPYQMWLAQMTLWVQAEILKALAAVNNDAAKQLASAGKGEQANVTNLPIKRIIRLAVGDYRAAPVLEDAGRGGGRPGAGAAPKRGRAVPEKPAPRKAGSLADLSRASFGGQRLPTPADAKPSQTSESLQTYLTGPTWTGRETVPDLDVVPIAMQLVIDQRYLPQVIDRICRTNFYVPVQVSYRQLTRSELGTEYVYGSAPVIEVTLGFERYFFPKVYAEKMPPEVHERLGHPMMAEGEEEDGKPGRGSRGRGTRGRTPPGRRG